MDTEIIVMEDKPYLMMYFRIKNHDDVDGVFNFAQVVAQEIEQAVYLSEGWWSDPCSFSLHVVVSWGKMLNSKVLLMMVPLVYECVSMSS